MMLFLSVGAAGLCPLPEPLISAALSIFLEQWFSQIIIETLRGRLAGSQVDSCGNAEKDLGSSTESGFAGDMINGRGIWAQRPGENGVREARYSARNLSSLHRLLQWQDLRVAEGHVGSCPTTLDFHSAISSPFGGLGSCDLRAMVQ